MKNILITGVSRTGKSTLSKMLYERLNSMTNAYSLVPFDPFIDSWKNKEMKSDVDKNEQWKQLEFSNTCREMIVYSINKLSQPQYLKQSFIFESAHASYDPKHFYYLLKKFGIENLKVIHLTHSCEYTKEILLEKVRENDSSNDWTHSKAEKELLFKFENALKANEKAIEYYREHNLEYFQTSSDRIDTFERICWDMAVKKGEENVH